MNRRDMDDALSSRRYIALSVAVLSECAVEKSLRQAPVKHLHLGRVPDDSQSLFQRCMLFSDKPPDSTVLAFGSVHILLRRALLSKQQAKTGIALMHEKVCCQI